MSTVATVVVTNDDIYGVGVMPHDTHRVIARYNVTTRKWVVDLPFGIEPMIVDDAWIRARV